MKLAIMQPYFFPYIGYFQAIKAVDKYILYENLDFIKEGWMSRNRILIKNQAPNYFSLVMQGSSSNKKIKDIKLNNSFNWRKKLINKVYLNYKGSPYFDESFSLIEECININQDFLHNYNSLIIKKICSYLEIDTQIQFDNSEYLQLEEKLHKLDLNNIELNIKTMRVFEICKIEKADIFINAIGGIELYSKSIFLNHDIKLFFIKTSDFEYNQLSNQFHPNLSIIDVLLNCGKEGTKTLLNKYELI